jgi:hypothetical protein
MPKSTERLEGNGPNPPVLRKGATCAAPPRWHSTQHVDMAVTGWRKHSAACRRLAPSRESVFRMAGEGLKIVEQQWFDALDRRRRKTPEDDAKVSRLDALALARLFLSATLSLSPNRQLDRPK